MRNWVYAHDIEAYQTTRIPSRPASGSNVVRKHRIIYVDATRYLQGPPITSLFKAIKILFIFPHVLEPVHIVFAWDTGNQFADINAIHH